MSKTTQSGPGGLLYRYLGHEMLFPTLAALGGLTAVVLTKDLLGYSDMVVNRGLGIEVVSRIAFYQTLPLAAKVLPFAVLVGSLVALGRLGADREILALEASGIPAHRLVGPVLLFAGALAALGFGLSVGVAPWASRSLDRAFAEISRQNPGAVLRVGSVQSFGRWKIEAREVSASGNRMRSVAVWMPRLGETAFARAGRLDPVPGGGTALVLEDGRVLIGPREHPRELRFASLRTELPGSARPLERDARSQLSGATRAELLAIGREVESDARLARSARVELQRRFSLPTATLVFGMLILPLFLGRAHFSRAGSGMLGIVATLVYYGLVQLGNGLVQAETLGVAAGVWLPNAVLGSVALLWVMRLPKLSSFGRHTGRPAFRERRSLAEVVAPHRGGRGGHIRVHRFALPRYVARTFLQMLGLAFGIILLAYLLVDVLERLQWFAKYDATAFEGLRFYAARIPLLASRVVPMSLLVATSLTVALLGVQGELTAIRACGIPAPRALLPVLGICALIVPCSFLLSNEIVPRSNALADYLKQTEIKGDAVGGGRSGDRESEDGESERRVWYRTAQAFTEADRMDLRLGTARNITVYELGSGGLPRSRVDAWAARHIGNGIWRLIDPVKVEIGENGPVNAPAAPFADLGDQISAQVDTMHLSVGELRRAIREVEAGGYEPTIYQVDLVVKIASPLACLVLPALALLFGVTGPPFPSAAVSLVLSAVVAVGYVLLTGVGASLGYGGALPPSVAGAAPTAVFALLALYFGLRLRGLGQSFSR